MNMIYNPLAPKKPTNLSNVVEAATAEELKRRKEVQWRKNNKDSIINYNNIIEDVGLFGDNLRSF